ncbi:MAG: LCP family protein, partial [Propionibacteriaceae bacterium]|nr:LCP family protein [Propionibacteriaceae bacterium]
LLGIPLMTWPFMPRTDATPAGDRVADTPGHVFLLAGSDSREGLSQEEQERLGTGNDAGRRTDTIMLLYVPPTGRAALVSIPRDSYVAIPGHGRNKINAAYAFGGPALLAETVEQNTGLRVDGFAEIGFGGFSGVVDAIGGIEMCPEMAIKDPPSNLDIPAGCQMMDGPTALGYVRMRKVDPQGDLGRAERQRAMIAALAKKAISPMTLLIPPRWFGLNWSLSRGITLGDDVGPGAMLGLANGGVRIALGQGDTLMVPVGDTNAQTNAGSSVLWHKTKSAALFEAMARGESDLTGYA